MASDSPMEAQNENWLLSVRSSSAGSSGELGCDVALLDRALYLADLYHRASIFHNLVGAVYYHKSQYGLGIQHFRHGIELLVEEERHLQQPFRVTDTQRRVGTPHNELANKCNEMERKLQDLQAQHGLMLRSIISGAIQRPCPFSSARQTTFRARREPILIDGFGNFHFLKSDGTSSPVLPASHPTYYSNMSEASSEQLCPSVVSSVVMHNLSICQACIGNYSTALELIRLSRETAQMACTLTLDPVPLAESTPSTAPRVMNSPQRPATPFYPPHRNGGMMSSAQTSIDFLQQCLDQVERRLITESNAMGTVRIDKRGEAAPAA